MICSVKNKKQAQAIAQEMIEKYKLKLYGLEGYEEGTWILLDFGDVVVHLFQEQLREFYNLEFLWSHASRVRWRT